MSQAAVTSWRQEYGTGRAFVEVQGLQARVQASVEGWPRELAAPVIKRFSDAWARTDKPVNNVASMRPLRDALAFAESIARELKTLRLEMVSGDSELCELAQRCAEQCQQYPDAAEWIVQRVGLEVPNGRHMTDTGKLLRMQDVRWWRRRMRAHFGQAVENAMRARGYVRKGRAPYCTDWTLRRRTSQRLRTETMLQAAVAVNELGEQMSLFDAAQASVSSKKNRRNELMTRIRGFEELATELGYVGLFGTHTCPSTFHAELHGGGTNPNYNGSSVNASRCWLSKCWALTRSALKKLGVVFFGFRIAEPHHDGTPHWHTILFVHQAQARQLVKVIKHYWFGLHDPLNSHAYEMFRNGRPNRKAMKARCYFKRMIPGEGGAAGYVAKYVSKNIDGFNVGVDDEAGGQSETTAHRVDAWASTHRIRQFQQIGGAKVGLWREARRIRDAGNVAVIEAARVCAGDRFDESARADWAGFCKLAPRLAIWKEQTGECNSYREVAQPKVKGLHAIDRKLLIEQRPSFKRWSLRRARRFAIVESVDVVASVKTRIHEWRVQWGGGAIRPADVLENGTAIRVQHGRVVQQVEGPRHHPSDSARAALPLGPVSITVRSKVSCIPTGSSPGYVLTPSRVASASPTILQSGAWPAERPNDGKLIYQHAGKWIVRQAINVSAPPWQKKLDPRYQFIQSAPFRALLTRAEKCQ